MKIYSQFCPHSRTIQKINFKSHVNIFLKSSNLKQHFHQITGMFRQPSCFNLLRIRKEVLTYVLFTSTSEKFAKVSSDFPKTLYLRDGNFFKSQKKSLIYDFFFGGGGSRVYCVYPIIRHWQYSFIHRSQYYIQVIVVAPFSYLSDVSYSRHMYSLMSRICSI